MTNAPLEVKAVEQYPQYGFTQKELRHIYVDHGARMLYDNDGNPEYIIRDDGPINPLRPDLSGFWLEKVNA